MKRMAIITLATIGWLCGGSRTMFAAESAAADAEKFTPVIEADMPAGFPERTALDQIEVKSYPKYRRATAKGAGAFGKLFLHIQSNGVEMTAPVEMDYSAEPSQAKKQETMSFLYGKPDIGKPGKQGFVEVNDVPAMTVVSIGMRGPIRGDAIEKGRARLEDWLSKHKDQYRADGPMRVMGHNSPFVPADRQYYEVQIPIRATHSS